MKLKNNALQELYDTLVSGNPTISPYAESPFDKAFRECDEKIQKDIDIWKCGNDILLSANSDLASIKKKLEKDITDAKVRLHFLTHSRDDWKRRVEHAEDEVEALKKDNKDLEKRLMETTEAFEKVNSDRSELQKDRDSYHELYTELSKTYNKLSEDNKKLKARTDCHRYEVEWYRKHYRDQSDKIENLKKQLEYLTSQYQKLTIENKRLQDGLREIGYEQGQTDLWDMLQTVKDMKPEEFDPECETLGDILDMDLEDFLDAYKNWEEEKHLNYMRDYLARFCEGRVCNGCPLESNEYKCGCGYSFKKVADWDMSIIPDEELERYYEKARGCGLESIKDACDAFKEWIKAGPASEVKEVPVSCDIPIKDLASWECAIEATVEVNKDLLEKVCGVKPDEEAHKLEYGDAVRVPWRDYDYMYIGRDKRGDGKMIRLFDPKNHSVAYVSSNYHLDIRGYKIIIDEEDLRKIWCDKDADKE